MELVNAILKVFLKLFIVYDFLYLLAIWFPVFINSAYADTVFMRAVIDSKAIDGFYIA